MRKLGADLEVVEGSTQHTEHREQYVEQHHFAAPPKSPTAPFPPCRCLPPFPLLDLRACLSRILSRSDARKELTRAESGNACWASSWAVAWRQQVFVEGDDGEICGKASHVFGYATGNQYERAMQMYVCIKHESRAPVHNTTYTRRAKWRGPRDLSMRVWLGLPHINTHTHT